MVARITLANTTEVQGLRAVTIGRRCTSGGRRSAVRHSSERPATVEGKAARRSDLADSFCRLVGVSGILGHLIWRRHSKMCIIYLRTLDNTFSFYIGCSDWHHELFFLPTKRRVCGPLELIVP